MTQKKTVITILFILSIFIFGGCAKKAVKESEMGAAGEGAAVEWPSKEVTIEGTGEPVGEEGAISREEEIGEEGVSAEIEEALKGLEEEGGEVARTGEEAREERTIEEGEEGFKSPSYEGLTEEEKETLKKIEEMAKKEGRLMPVYFDFDKYSLREDAKRVLRENALWLKANNHVKVLIEGHADERGSNEYNLALGEKRARSVLQYLRALGVDAELSTISYGEERPVCYEHNEECWWRNRRAEFRILSGNYR